MYDSIVERAYKIIQEAIIAGEPLGDIPSLITNVEILKRLANDDNRYYRLVKELYADADDGY